MIDMPDLDAILAALRTPLAPDLHDLITTRLQDAFACDLADLTAILVIQRGDTEAQIIDAIGFSPLVSRMPPGYIALHFTGELSREKTVDALKELGAPPLMWFRIGPADALVFRYLGGERLTDKLTKLDGLAIRQEGDMLPLPTGEDIGRSKVQTDNIADLPEIGIENIEALAAMLPLRTRQHTPLQKFSMLGESASFAMRVETRLGHSG